LWFLNIAFLIRREKVPVCETKSASNRASPPEFDERSGVDLVMTILALRGMWLGKELVNYAQIPTMRFFSQTAEDAKGAEEVG